MSKNKCPICKKETKEIADNKYYPFCAERCKTIDLGKWVFEEYKVETDDSESNE